MLSSLFNILRLNAFASCCRNWTDYRGKLLIGCAVVVGCHGFSICISQEQASVSMGERPFVVVKLANPTFRTVHSTVEIGSIQRGSTTTIPFRFENNLGGDVAFKKVVVQCACTGAKIPEETIRSGETVDGAVNLDVSKGYRGLSKTFSFEVISVGSVERILVDLKASITGVVAFSQDHYTTSVDVASLQSGKPTKLTIPVIASSEMDLSDAVASVSGSLVEKSGKSVAVEYKSFREKSSIEGVVGSVEVQIAPGALVSESEYFTVELKSSHFPMQTVPVVVRKKLPVTLIPETLYFSSTDLENIQAIGLVRVANDLDGSSLKLISAKLETGEELTASIAVGNRSARLEFTCSKENAIKLKNSTKNLEVLVECEGKQYLIHSKCRFQW
jgi:hypothetical protein